MLMIEFFAELTGWAIARLVIMQVLIFLLIINLIKSRKFGLADPFSLAIFFFASGWATVFELFITNRCEFKYLITFLTTNTTFILGYVLVAPKTKETPTVKKLRYDKKFSAYGISVFSIYTTLSIINIITFGFGISHENRLDIYRESGGLGVIKRFLDAYMPVAIFSLVYYKATHGKRSNLICNLFFGFIGINTVLDGSKSGLVAVFFAYSLSTYWARVSGGASKIVDAHRIWPWILFAASIAFFVIGVQINVADDFSRISDVVTILFFRLFIAGDVFVLGFPYGTIDAIPQPTNSLLILFSDLLSTLRLWSAEVTPLGTQLIIHLTPGLTELSGGPNSHISIYAYYLFGSIGGAILSFIFGVIIGAIRLGFKKSINVNPIMSSIMVALLLNTANMPIDPAYTLHRLTNITLLLIPLSLFFMSIKFNQPNQPLK